jgi:DNA/RNA non-specific endonuclease
MAIVPVYTSAVVTLGGVGITVPLTAEAVLTSTNMTGGTGPSGSIRPPGFVTGSCPNHHQRGHLIGNKLGGSGTDARNLVTLTEGSNHPAMYEFENMVYAFVRQNPGMNFTYRVTAQYNVLNYSAAPAVPHGAPLGVLGNPYCPPPCPESLKLELIYTNAHGVSSYPIATAGYDGAGVFQQQLYQAVIIQNGMYKFHEGSVRHVANQCWAS